MVAASALRSALSAIANAEAVDCGTGQAVVASSPHFAGAVAGLGAAEAERRSLSAAEIDQIVRAEVSDRQLAAREYERGGHADQADRLRREARVLLSVVADQDAP